MNMNYNYLTIMFRSSFAQMYNFLVEKYIGSSLVNTDRAVNTDRWLLIHMYKNTGL